MATHNEMALLLGAAMEILSKTLSEGDAAGYKGKWLGQSAEEHRLHASAHWDNYCKTLSEEEKRHLIVRMLMEWVKASH